MGMANDEVSVKVTASGAFPLVGVTVKAATGGAETETAVDILFVLLDP
jgi:hypothetical protein